MSLFKMAIVSNAFSNWYKIFDAQNIMFKFVD